MHVKLKYKSKRKLTPEDDITVLQTVLFTWANMTLLSLAQPPAESKVWGRGGGPEMCLLGVSQEVTLSMLAEGHVC